MKKILAICLVALTQFTFAEEAHQTVETPTTSRQEANAPSKIYHQLPKERIVMALDGATAIIHNPTFESEEGEVFSYSSSANYDQICKRKGFENAAGHSKSHTRVLATPKMIDIDNEGNIKHTVSEDRVLFLFCRLKPEQIVPSSLSQELNSEKVTKDPITGNVTLTNPNFGKILGYPISISPLSDLDAVCALFGLNGGEVKHEYKEAAYSKNYDTKEEAEKYLQTLKTVEPVSYINSSGRIIAFDLNKRYVEHEYVQATFKTYSKINFFIANQSAKSLTSLTCAPE